METVQRAIPFETYGDGPKGHSLWDIWRRSKGPFLWDIWRRSKGPFISEHKMTAVNGSMKIQLPGKPQQTFMAGESFDVPANSSFDVNVSTDTAYLCLYG